MQSQWLTPRIRPRQRASGWSIPWRTSVARRYTVNGGAVRAGVCVLFIDFDQEVVIRFDRGGGAGVARCLLQDGTYRFRPVDGHWNLVRDDDELAGDGQLGDIAANPVPGMLILVAPDIESRSHEQEGR